MTAIGRRLVAAVGLLSLATAAVLAWAPDLAAGVIDVAALERTVDERLGWTTLLAGIAVALVVALWKGRSSADADTGSLTPESSPSSHERADVPAFDRAVSSAGERTGLSAGRRDPVGRRLRHAAADRIAATDGVDEATARERVDAGHWTEDRLVAGFLGDERAPDPPLRWRLYAWLYADRAVERAVDRTIAAIDAYPEGES